jgi:hypothetical protein
LLIPHLMFAHMLADYVLQSNWLVARKSESWAGLIIHGGIVGFVSLMAISPYLSAVWFPLLMLMILHTFQDYLKVYFSPRLNIHPFGPYMADQFIHYAVIGGFQLWIGERVVPKPPPTEIAFMWVGAAVIAVTRFYDITWWANWLDMIPYLNRWRQFAYAERLSMLALSAAGLWYIAPLCLVPRLAYAKYTARPIWRQRRSALEMGMGAALSITLGIGLRAVLAQI